MPEFLYTAKSLDGRTVEGSRVADSETSLVSQLRKEDLIVISIVPQAAKRPPREKKGKKIKVRDLAVVCGQLSAMLDAGLPVLESLEGISEQVENKMLGQILREVATDIEAGSTLSQALAKHGKVFSTLFISMTRAGEEAGALPKVMNRLAAYLEARDALARKIRSASAYPAFIAGFFVIAVAAIMFFLIPKFEAIFSDFDLELPTLTKILIATSRFMGHNILWEILALALATYLFFRWKGSENGKRRFDAWMLSVPMFGKIVRKAAVARFSKTLGTLLDNGVSVVDALEIVGETAGNSVVKEAVDSVGEGVINGSTISGELSECKVFPKMVVSMVSAGESSGDLPKMLDKVADFYTREVDAAISTLTSMIEPVLIVGLGAIVTVVVLAIYLPIFQMATGID